MNRFILSVLLIILIAFVASSVSAGCVRYSYNNQYCGYSSADYGNYYYNPSYVTYTTSYTYPSSNQYVKATTSGYYYYPYTTSYYGYSYPTYSVPVNNVGNTYNNYNFGIYIN